MMRKLSPLAVIQWCKDFNQPYKQSESAIKLNFNRAPLTLNRFKGFCERNYINYEHRSGGNYIIHFE